MDGKRQQGIALLVALLFLAAATLVAIMSLSWALSSREQGKVLQQHLKVITTLGVALDRARAQTPPVEFEEKIDDIDYWTGEFTKSATGKLSTAAVSAMPAFSWEEARGGVIEFAVTAQGPLAGGRGKIIRAKTEYDRSTIPR